MAQFIPVNTPLLGGNEKKYINECIDTGWISSEGPFVKRFEEEFAARVERKFAVAVANGTAALEIALRALDLPDGSEVIMPSHTIISCAQAIVKAGLKPVLVDSDIDTWNMDVGLIESKITDQTSAIMIVHLYGMPVDMDPIMALAKKHKLRVIEDAAQMLGQTYKGKPCGSFGDISTFSFYPNKQITTGEGGMCVVNDQHLADRCAGLRNLCFGKQRFIHDEMGWNYRMTNIQAALGVAQLERLDAHVTRKRDIGKQYQQLLGNNSKFILADEQVDFADNIYWIIGLLINEDLPHDALYYASELQKNGIGTRPFFYPMHLQPVFQKMGLFVGEEYPVAETLYKRGFYIPSGLGIDDGQISEVAKAVLKMFG